MKVRGCVIIFNCSMGWNLPANASLLFSMEIWFVNHIMERILSLDLIILVNFFIEVLGLRRSYLVFQ